MRVGTWNLESAPSPFGSRGRAIQSFLDNVAADIWLLTEVHSEWPRTTVSPARGAGPPHQRWAGIATVLPLFSLACTGSVGNPHPGEEGLCIARLTLPGGATLLLACSVWPWRGARPHWPGLSGTTQAEQVSCVLDHHVKRIREVRREDEPLLWGGDFNQELAAKISAGTKAGCKRLHDLMDDFGLVALTADAEHLIPGYRSIISLFPRPRMGPLRQPIAPSPQQESCSAIMPLIRLT